MRLPKCGTVSGPRSTLSLRSPRMTNSSTTTMRCNISRPPPTPSTTTPARSWRDGRRCCARALTPSTSSTPRSPPSRSRATDLTSGSFSKTYLENNKGRLRFATPREAGCPIGSGATEGAAKSVIACRCSARAHGGAHLYCARYSRVATCSSTIVSLRAFEYYAARTAPRMSGKPGDPSAIQTHPRCMVETPEFCNEPERSAEIACQPSVLMRRGAMQRRSLLRGRGRLALLSGGALLWGSSASKWRVMQRRLSRYSRRRSRRGTTGWRARSAHHHLRHVELSHAGVARGSRRGRCDFCAARALDADLPRRCVAWLSSSTIDTRDRAGSARGVGQRRWAALRRYRRRPRRGQDLSPGACERCRGGVRSARLDRDWGGRRWSGGDCADYSLHLGPEGDSRLGDRDHSTLDERPTPGSS